MQIMETESDRATALWAPSRFRMGTRLLTSVSTFVVGVSALSATTDWDELAYLGAVGLFLSGLGLGGFLSMWSQRRMMHRHMAADHPDVSARDRS